MLDCTCRGSGAHAGLETPTINIENRVGALNHEVLAKVYCNNDQTFRDTYWENPVRALGARSRCRDDTVIDRLEA